MNMTDLPRDPVPAISEIDAPPAIATIFADIRTTLDSGVVNLIWRHLATMPGALEWVWTTVKPLYLEHAPAHAERIHAQLALPALPAFSHDTLVSAGINEEALTSIRAILDSYHHTNALALVCLSAFLSRYEDHEARVSVVSPIQPNSPASVAVPRQVMLPALPVMSELAPAVQGLIQELNGFGEDSDTELVASMYRHLSYWPTYLSLIRTLLVPLHSRGELIGLVATARQQGEAHGRQLAQLLPSKKTIAEIAPVLTAVRRFVRHPIARMTAVCTILREATLPS
jgi:hypothetical protein